MFGLSYWGYAQLVLGAGAPDYLKALVPQMSASRVYGVYRNSGSLSLDTVLTWCYETYVMNAQSVPAEKQRAKRQQDSVLLKGFMHLPLREADQVVLNFTSPFFQGILCNDQPDDEFWTVRDYSEQSQAD